MHEWLKYRLICAKQIRKYREKLMRILLKTVWFVLFLVLVAVNLIMSIGMKIGERAFGFFILVMILGGIMSVTNQCWESLKCVEVLSATGFAVLFITVIAQVFLEDWRDSVKERLFSMG